MAKIPVAQQRLFQNVFVCKRCSLKKRSAPRQILEGKVKCRKCGGKAFRPISRRK
ncbi:MAG: hypothetical protein AABX59_00150 [Nanoarchaeota archaeon]